MLVPCVTWEVHGGCQCGPVWSGVVLSGPWRLPVWFMTVYGGSCWFMLVHAGSCWSMVVHGCRWSSMVMVVCGGP